MRDNNDRYPDLYCVLEGIGEVPAEVEWKTSNFIQHGHDIRLLKDKQGFIFVLQRDQDLGFDIPQVEIDIENFEQWMTKNALKLIQATTAPYKVKSFKRKIPKLWLTYISQKAGGISDFEREALEHHTWGVHKKYSPSVINNISSMQKKDLIGFIGPGRNFPGRVSLTTWSKKSFKGYFERIRVYTVNKGYFYDEDKIIWEGTGKWKGEVFPHRFGFNPKVIINRKDIVIKKLSATAKQELHSMVYGNLIPASPSTLVDILYHSKPI